jgi:digeranylgeranylglycerophospholipid reductase
LRDVVVVGAGPAGLCAARQLASCGHDVVVLEEHPAIGVPTHCTGLLGLDAFSELEIPRHTILDTARAARFVAPDGSTVVVETDGVRAAIIDRAAFDQALADASCAAGAELRASTPAQSVTIHDDGVTVSLGNHRPPIRARACVLACGANYRFNRRLGLGVPRAFVQSAQLEQPFAGPDKVEVHLGRLVAPRGFAWLVPFHRDGQPHHRIGLMAEARAGVLFKAFVDRVCRRFGLNASQSLPPRLKVLPLAPVAKTFGRRLLAVGDAAGLVKPTTGGGIYYSLVSGQLAAETLHDALCADELHEARLREYETRWRERLGAEIRIGLMFRRLASRLSDRGIDALVDLARIDGIVPLLKQTADFNWHRESALVLLRHAQFRRILLSSLWS